MPSGRGRAGPPPIRRKGAAGSTTSAIPTSPSTTCATCGSWARRCGRCFPTPPTARWSASICRVLLRRAIRCRSRWAGTRDPPPCPRRQGRQGRRFDFRAVVPQGGGLRSLRMGGASALSRRENSTASSPRFWWISMCRRTRSSEPPASRSAVTRAGSGPTALHLAPSSISAITTGRGPLQAPAKEPLRVERRSAGMPKTCTTSRSRSTRSIATKAGVMETLPFTCSINQATRAPGATVSRWSAPRPRSPGSTGCTGSSPGPRSPTCTGSRAAAPSSP